MVENYIPYLVPGDKRCKPQKPTGSMTFCSVAPAPSAKLQPGVSGGSAVHIRPRSKVNKCHDVDKAMPFDDEPAIVEYVEDARVGGEEQSASDDECVDHVPPVAKKSLQEEANSLYHLVTHTPKNPYCEACRRAQMKEKRKYAGS